MSVLASCLVIAAVALTAIARPGRGRRVHQLRQEVVGADDAVAAFELVVGDIRSGASLHAAVVDALHRHREVLPWLREALDRGDPLEVALTREPAHEVDADRSEDDWFAHGLSLCGITNGTGAEVLDRAVASARERRAWRAERRAQAAQALLSARLLTALPLGFSAWGVLTSSSVRAAFRDTPLTAICLAVGLSLNALGWWWMRRLVMVDAA